MMIDLWKILDKTCPGSIPPGIIFLPGEKLKDPSFGWAPKTWLSNEELEYPDPLSNMVGAARLVPEGLLVQYPGFVLHAQNRASILRENESSFHFPSDSTLLEWYGVELSGLRNNLQLYSAVLSPKKFPRLRYSSRSKRKSSSGVSTTSTTTPSFITSPTTDE